MKRTQKLLNGKKEDYDLDDQDIEGYAAEHKWARLILKYSDRNVMPGILIWLMLMAMGAAAVTAGIYLSNADGLAGGMFYLFTGMAMTARYRHVKAGQYSGHVCMAAGAMEIIAGIWLGTGAILAGACLAGIGLEVTLKDKGYFSGFQILLCSCMVSIGMVLAGHCIFANEYMEVCGRMFGLASIMDGA